MHGTFAPKQAPLTNCPQGSENPFSGPRSHIVIDILTDLPSSLGFTAFFKACKLIPLNGLPTAIEMATALF